MGDEAFMQSHLGALATGAVGDLQIELALPLRVHLCLQVIEQPIPTHRVYFVVATSIRPVDHTRFGRLVSTAVIHRSWQALVNVGKLH